MLPCVASFISAPASVPCASANSISKLCMTIYWPRIRAGTRVPSHHNSSARASAPRRPVQSNRARTARRLVLRSSHGRVIYELGLIRRLAQLASRAATSLISRSLASSGAYVPTAKALGFSLSIHTKAVRSSSRFTTHGRRGLVASEASIPCPSAPPDSARTSGVESQATDGISATDVFKRQARVGHYLLRTLQRVDIQQAKIAAP